MNILVTDANILIDLLKTESEGSFFSLEQEIYTTLAVIIECDDKQQEILNEYIKTERLRIYKLKPEDDEKIEDIILNNRRLSPADCSVLYITTKLEAILLTGDSTLRKKAENIKQQVCGIFWVFDEMLKQKVIDKIIYKRKLTKLKEVNRWLPEDEFGKRL